MLAFSPSLLAYFAAVSATGIRLVDSAAIPRPQENTVSRDASTLSGRTNPRLVVFNDEGRPRWGFVIPNRKRSSQQVPPTMPAPLRLAKPARGKSKGKAKSNKSKDRKTSKASGSQNSESKKKSKPSASDSTPAHHNHSKHVPGSHHRDSREGNKKEGGRNAAERRIKLDKRHSIVTVALGNGRYGHKYETSAVVWRAAPDSYGEGDRRSHSRAHARDLVSDRRRHSRHNSRHHRALLDAKLPVYHIHGSGVADISIPVVSHAIVAPRADYAQDDHRHRSRAIISADVPGTIDIKSIFPSSDLQVKLASLVLTTDPTTNASFVMNANNNTATPVYLHVVPGATAPPDANGNSVKVVSLRIPVFDRTEATEADYCAQFDPIPTAPVPLTAEPCLNHPASPANLTDSAFSHASQSFAYTPSTGAIMPIWLNANTPVSSTANSTATAKRNANCDDDETSTATTQFNAINGTSSQTNATASANSSSPQAVGVMMYFEPLVSAQVYSVDPSSGGSSAAALASGSATANGGVEGSGNSPGSEDTDTESSDTSEENSVGGSVDSNASVSASTPSSAAATPASTAPQPTSDAPAPLTSSASPPPAPPTSPPTAPTSVPATPTPFIKANVIPASETPSPSSTQHDAPSPAVITVTTTPSPSPCSPSCTTTSSSPDGAAATTSSNPDASASYEWLFTPDES